MTNSKSTKRALLMSMMSIMLCVSMLLGTTFAWFTDSAVSGNNIIKAGNLDMKLSYKPYGAENTGWTEVKADSIIFGENALYEPGYTEAVWLRVDNLGSLAFRYNLAVKVAGEKQGTNSAGAKFSLSDYLEVKYLTTTSCSDMENFYKTRESLDSFAWGGAVNSGVASLSDDIAVIENGVVYSEDDAEYGAYNSSYVLVVISMPTTVDNKANHNGEDVPEINFTISALATQLTHEEDSFGNQYDKDAQYSGALNKNGNVYTLTGDATLTDEPLMSDYSATEAYTVNGNGATVTGVVTSADSFQWTNNGTIPAMSTIFSSADGAKVTVNDVTFTGTMSAVMAGNYVNSSSNWFNTEFNNVNIVNAEVVSFSSNVSPALCVYGNLTMNNCTMTGTKLSALDTDPMWPAYDIAAVNYSNTFLNNCKIGSFYMWNQAQVTVGAGTKVDTIIIRGNMNANKYGLVVADGATVDSIDLTAITNINKVNITIEDGATVGAFVDNGITYDSLEAWKNAQ